MSASREGPNPLRPYYIPPSIGIPPESSSSPIPLGANNGGSAASYASSARDILIDIDYSDYLSDSSPSSVETVRAMLDEALYKYFSVLLAQPFEVAKTVLQVKGEPAGGSTMPVAVAEVMRIPQSNRRDSTYGDYDSDADEPAYFTSSAPSAYSYSPPQSRRRHDSDRSGDKTPPAIVPSTAHQLSLTKPGSILEVISQEWTKEGAWGMWKASNATFVYSVLLKTIESWSRGLISALLNVPDPGLIPGLGSSVDMVDSPYPWASLGVAVAAAAAAGIILAPLDLVRTKLILTPTSTPKRSLVHNLRILPSYMCPPTLMVPTVLHSVISPVLAHSTPILLSSRLSIDPVLTPTTYSLASFLSRTVDLFLKLPLETVLRRAQMSVLASPSYCSPGRKSLETIVDVGPYYGVFGTMWSIVRQEGVSTGVDVIGKTSGSRALRKGKNIEKRGQGVEGLWRGWRVGMWGLVGVWGARALGSSGNGGGEF